MNVYVESTHSLERIAYTHIEYITRSHENGGAAQQTREELFDERHATLVRVHWTWHKTRAWRSNHTTRGVVTTSCFFSRIFRLVRCDNFSLMTEFYVSHTITVLRIWTLESRMKKSTTADLVANQSRRNSNSCPRLASLSKKTCWLNTLECIWFLSTKPKSSLRVYIWNGCSGHKKCSECTTNKKIVQYMHIFRKPYELWKLYPANGGWRVCISEGAKTRLAQNKHQFIRITASRSAFCILCWVGWVLVCDSKRWRWGGVWCMVSDKVYTYIAYENAPTCMRCRMQHLQHCFL